MTATQRGAHTRPFERVCLELSLGASVRGGLEVPAVPGAALKAECSQALAETGTGHTGGGQAGAAGARTRLRAGPMQLSPAPLTQGLPSAPEHRLPQPRELPLAAAHCSLPPPVCWGPLWAARPKAALGHGRAQKGLGEEESTPRMVCAHASHCPAPIRADVKAAPLPPRGSYVRIVINGFLAAF